MSKESLQSFSLCLSGTVPHSSGTTTSTPSWLWPDTGPLVDLEGEWDEEKRRITTRWLEANIASLVGSDAVDALSELLEDPTPNHVERFLQKVLDWRITQDVGIHQYSDAVR